jgi:hypothetical protein
VRLISALVIALSLVPIAQAETVSKCRQDPGHVRICDFPLSTFNHGYDAAYLGVTGSRAGVLILPRKSEVGAEKYNCLYRHEMRHANERGSESHPGYWETCR